MIKKRKAQFYIISAFIIIAIIITLSGISNYASTKKEPENFYRLSDILAGEGPSIIDNSLYNGASVEESLENFNDIYRQYLNEVSNVVLNVTIIYGSITDQKITKVTYYSSSVGNINIGSNMGTQTTEIISLKEEIPVTYSSGKKSVNINVNGITHEIPLLDDNNFIFVMTTNDGLNDYIVTHPHQN